MRVALDLRMADIFGGGIERYTFKVFEELIKINEDGFFPFPSSKNKYGLLFKNTPNLSIDFPISDFEKMTMYTSFLSGINELDFIYSTYYPIVPKNHYRYILTIHDLIPIIHPEYFSGNMTDFFLTHVKESALGADMIIADSYATKKDIINYFGVKEEKIKVIYLGAEIINDEKNNSSPDDTLKKFNLLGVKYILSVCTLEPRKNLKSVIASFEEIKPQYPNLKLVLVGSTGWKFADLLNQISISKYVDDIIVTGFVDNSELQIMYQNAMLFVYPSLYEGFGLPILEAMAYGVPTITSNVSSLPEVGGDAVEYCNPYDVNSVASAIQKVLNSEELRIDLKLKGIERAKMFTWEKTAKQIYDVITEVYYKK